MKILGMIVAYLFAFVVARFLGAEAWGEFSLALSMILTAAILGIVGLDNALLKLISGTKNKIDACRLYRKGFVITLSASLFTMLILYLMSNWLASSLFNNPSLTSTFQLASLGVVPFSLMKLNASTLQALKRVKKYVFLKFVSHHLLGSFFLLLLLFFTDTSHVVLTAYILGLYIIVIISSYWLIKESLIEIGNVKGTDTTSYFSILKFSLPLLLAGSMMFLINWIDTVMVGMFLTERDVGIYNIALKLSGLLLIFLTAVNTVAAPIFSENFTAGNFKNLQQSVQYSTKLIFILTVPVFVLMVLFPEFILGIFGEAFQEGKPALIILCFGNLMNALAGSAGYFLLMTNSQIAFMNITAGSAILAIILNYLLIPIMGIEGAALATCIGMFVWNGACILFIRQTYNIKTYFSPFSS